ncbi:MAG: ribosome-binding factor A [Chloroflexi bacterium RBG_19FT_COMBO_47_9]|nr:MAG: ribosome-binding factor A [Chloroflexi bacterium RBG_19FT_COMBO_47_9]
MVSKTRLTRISERIRQELSEIILMQSSDPRLKGVMVTDVEVDRELAFAEIYVCTIEGIQQSQEVLAGLDHAQGFLRSELAHRMELRTFPKLRFHWDPTLEHADEIERLFKSIHQDDSLPHKVTPKKRVVKRNGSTT